MIKSKLESWLRRRFIGYHGEGEPHQADVYRCQTCGRLITWNMIRSANVCCAGRLIPAQPTALEAFRLLALPWTV